MRVAESILRPGWFDTQFALAYDGKGSGRTMDSRHWLPSAVRQNVTLLTNPITHCCAIQRLTTVVSRRNRRAIVTFPGSRLRR